MSTKIYWNYLLVLFGVLLIGIIGTLSEKDIDESSELLIRQKRVINRTPGGDVKEVIKHVPYIVIIKIPRTPKSCVGVILSNHIVLTIAKCVEQETTLYKVFSGTARLALNGRHVTHNVMNKVIFHENPAHRSTNGIALVTVTPSFVYSINTRNIEFYNGHIQPGTYGIVSGWGVNPPGQPIGTEYSTYLRSIYVPIISNYDCKMLYINHFTITYSDICTLDETGHQHCCVGDEGAPLVIEVNYRKYLVGIFLWKGAIAGHRNPDVFANLQFPTYRNWIVQTMHNLEAHLDK